MGGEYFEQVPAGVADMDASITFGAPVALISNEGDLQQPDFAVNSHQEAVQVVQAPVVEKGPMA